MDLNMYTKPLEASVTYSICTQLENLGWIVDERNPLNNVTQQRVRTEQQQTMLRRANRGNLTHPDFVLYENGTNTPIGVIEAKRPGESLESALDQATVQYATPLQAPLIFAYNETFVATRYLHNGRALKIDGEDVRQFVDHYTSLRFVNEGPEILSAPPGVQVSRDELIRIFKRQADLLREAGLQAGLERFSAFSDVLFLKLIDEISQIREHARMDAPIPESLRWTAFRDKKPKDRLDYVKNYVWPEMNKRYREVFGQAFPIQSAQIFDDIVSDLSKLNFTGTDVDVKGDAFEYFLKNAYQGIKIKDLGEYFTPRNIVRTMVSMINPKIGEKVYDPFCGTGGFLIEAFRYMQIRSHPTEQVSQILKESSIYGTELLATARVARMNMILYGDGHSNVYQRDSFSNPVHELYDIVLTNPPYSQKTRYGYMYPIPSKSGDVIAIQHCVQSLKPDGRAAILVKEDFLSKGGNIGKVRNMLLNSVRDISVVSLPRKLFEPYTPTKTSIIYFKKNGTKAQTNFFVVKNVGHDLGAKKRSHPKNDLPTVLSAFQEGQAISSGIDSLLVGNDIIRKTESSLWMYDYTEVLPPNADQENTERLGSWITKSGRKLRPSASPYGSFKILGVGNTEGVYFNEEKLGQDINQSYIQVHEDDLVYNPHRVNVGSIGLVPKELDGGIVSGIYVVFRSIDPNRLPSRYILELLKSEPYLNIIRTYDTKSGAVRANLNWEQLQRIRIVVPSEDRIAKFKQQQKQILRLQEQLNLMKDQLAVLVN